MKKETIKPKKLISAAIVALILAFISTKLTSFVNSAVLLALVSVGTLVGRELVEASIEKLHHSLREMVEKEITREHEVIRIKPEDKTLEEKDSRHFMGRLLASKWATTLVFAGVALVFVGISFGVGRLSYQKPETVVQHTTKVIKASKNQIASAQKNALEGAAANTKSQLKKSQTNELGSAQSLVSQSQQHLDDLIVSLQNQVKGLQGLDGKLSAANSTSTGEISKLKINIQSLENRVAGLGKITTTQSSTTTSTAPTIPTTNSNNSNTTPPSSRATP
jgi:hypothetical protein